MGREGGPLSGWARFPGRRALRTGTPVPIASRDGGGPAIQGQSKRVRCCRIVLPGWDSDLEASSHNPTDGSFPPHGLLLAFLSMVSKFTRHVLQMLNLGNLNRIPPVSQIRKQSAYLQLKSTKSARQPSRIPYRCRF